MLLQTDSLLLQDLSVIVAGLNPLTQLTSTRDKIFLLTDIDLLTPAFVINLKCYQIYAHKFMKNVLGHLA